jgi:large subunit ribosomal protein L29
MPFLRSKEIREMSPEKRMEKITELRNELRKLTAMTKAGGSVDNPSRMKEIRKAIARILTVQSEERLEARDR